MAFFRTIFPVVALAASGMACGETTSANFLSELAAGRPQTIVVYGTSLTASAAWPAEFQDTLRATFGRKFHVINAAGGGKDSRWGLANLNQRVLRQRPDTVFIEFAVNDALAASDLGVAESMANLDQMIGRIRTERPYCDVIVMIMNPPTGPALEARPHIRDYEQGYRRVAERNQCRLIDFSRTWRAIMTREPNRWREYVPDGLHPNRKACREVILPKLLEKSGFYAHRQDAIAMGS